MILNTKHVAVIRAALEYWDDEMSPHPPAVYTAYFTEPIGDGKWIKEAVTELRKQLPICRLRYFLYSPETGGFDSTQLFESHQTIPDDRLEGGETIATALFSQSET